MSVVGILYFWMKFYIMKELSDKEFRNAPADIKQIYIHALNEWPIGSSLMKRAMEKYPEYFTNDIYEEYEPEEMKPFQSEEIKELEWKYLHEFAKERMNYSFFENEILNKPTHIRCELYHAPSDEQCPNRATHKVITKKLQKEAHLCDHCYRSYIKYTEEQLHSLNIHLL